MADKTKVELLTNRLKELFKRDDAFVLTINGQWGVGKTHFWNNFKKTHLNKDKKVSYVSLFGKETIQDIRTDIILQISKKDTYIDSISGSIANIKSSIGLKDEEMSFGLTGSLLASMMTLLKKKDFKDVIICFDDFERLSKKLDPKDLLGLMSELKEQKNCQVVLIFNQDKVNDKTLSVYKDKIIDYEFEYAPTPEQSYKLIQDSLKVFKDYPLTYFKNNNINNIRVMKRVIDSINDFAFIEEHVKDHKHIEQEVVENIIEISTINALFLFKKFEKLSKYSREKSSSKSSYGASKDTFKSQKKFDKILSYIDFGNIGVFYPSDITNYMIDYVKSSMVYKEALILMVESRKAQSNRQGIHSGIRAVYDKFTYNMGYEISQFVIDLYEIFTVNANEIVNVLESNSFIFYINLIEELDEGNKKEYHTFGVKCLKEFLPNLLNSDERYHIWGEEKLKNIRDYDESLGDFIDTYKNDKIEKKIDSVEKIIMLMKKPLEETSFGKEPQLLMMVSDETYEKYILESQEFVDICVSLIYHYRKHSNSGFEPFSEKIIRIFEKLKSSGNKNYEIKITKMLNLINENAK